MSDETPHTVTAEASFLPGPQRRRSPRFGSPGVLRENEAKMALGVKRSITVRKIAPRKTAALSVSNKENTPRRSQETRVSTPKTTADTRVSPVSSAARKRPQPAVLSPILGSSSAGRRKQQQPAVLSPILGSSSTGRRKQQQPAVPSPILGSSSAGRRKQQQPAVPSPILGSTQPADPEDSDWSRKVRRSYSRLSDSSLRSPENSDALFGFERLNSPEVIRSRVEPSRSILDVSKPLTSLLEAEEPRCEPDLNIPGVAVVKARRRRRRVPQIDTEELEVLAAQMNAEFREAEEFELVVE